MSTIERNPSAFAETPYDLVVAGGGIYGCCVALEASRRGLDVLLLERDDFGGATSRQALRLIHGGLRYLQHADWRRCCESVAEQAWWLQTFPDLVRPRSCLLPLSGERWHRPTVMRFALATYNRIAHAVRSAGGYPPSLPAAGRLLNVVETCERASGLDAETIRGGLLWHDAQVVSPPRLLLAILHWAVACGARCLNYMPLEEVQPLEKSLEIHARCSFSQQSYIFRARHLIHCAGPWTQELGKRCHRLDPPAAQALAMNVLVDQPPPSRDALAVRARRVDANTYFLLPFGDQTLIGTEHLPDRSEALPTRDQIRSFLEHVNEAHPSLQARPKDVVELLVGRLPAQRTGSPLPSRRPRVIHHPAGNQHSFITSVTGVKYTTARSMAERVLRELFRRQGQTLPPISSGPRPHPMVTWSPGISQPTDLANRTARDLQDWFDQESVQHIDDFLLRRIDTLGLPAQQRIRLAQDIMHALDWSSQRREAECQRLQLPTRCDLNNTC